jgi:endonuclease/exonuclease/phosphatase family metal-dependent hydrolase
MLGRVDPVAFCELMTALRADVVVMQESDVVHSDALAAAGWPHGHFEPRADHTGMGIALRNPVAAVTPVPMAWREGWEATLEPAHWPQLSRPLTITNLHVAAPHVRRPPFYGFLLRRRQANQLDAHFEAKLPAADSAGRANLVIGDFNATPIWPLYGRIAKHFTDEAIAVAQRLGRDVEPTWGPLGRARRLRLDHAMTRGISARDVHVVAIEGSDHSALVVDLVP